MRRFAGLALCALGIAGCSARPPAGSPPPPARGAVSSDLFDAGAVYRSMGLLVARAPLPFVASLHYLADAAPDSTLAVFGLSLANRALKFERDGDEFVARYHVEVAFRGDTGPARQFASDDVVRVRTFAETQRGDESVIYQQVFGLAPGAYRVSVTVRDRAGPAVAHDERTDTVPRLSGRSWSAPLPVYNGRGRARLAEVPQVLVNPRAAVSYGADSLRFYVEAYGFASGVRFLARALDRGGRELWRDTVALQGTDTLAVARVVVRPAALPVGQGRLEVQPLGGAADAATARATPFLVSFSDQLAITNFEQMVSLLRYFERPEWVERLRQAPLEQRPALWREFYTATDPDPATPQNEALEEYFRRVQIADQRFREGSDPGWLTDRGEVFITLGEPDDIYDFSTDVSRTGPRGIRWTYAALRLTLFFQDQTGFGRFRLTPLSRAEFQRVVARIRQGR